MNEITQGYDNRHKLAEIEVNNLAWTRELLVSAWIRAQCDKLESNRDSNSLRGEIALKIKGVDARIGDLIRNGVTAIGCFDD